MECVRARLNTNMPHRLVASLALLLGTFPCVSQTLASPPVLKVQSSLVLVPALVKTGKGELVFSLSADNFVLRDDGVPQHLRVESDTDLQPLALVVLAQTGNLGASHLGDYSGLNATLDAMIGAVQHRVAVLSFDSSAHLEQPFTSTTDAAATALK